MATPRLFSSGGFHLPGEFMEKKVALYDLTEDMKSLEQLMAMDHGEVTPEFEALQKEVTDAISLKVDGYIGFSRMLEDEVEAGKKRIKELTVFVTARENSIARLKEYALMSLTNAGEMSFKGEFGQISRRKPTKVLEILDEKKVPLNFVTFDRITKIDKTAIKKAIVAGEEIDGCHLINGKASVQFKRKSVKGDS